MTTDDAQRSSPQRWEAGREGRVRTVALLAVLAVLLAFVTVALAGRYAGGPFGPAALVALGLLAAGWLVLVVVAVRTLRAVTVVTRYADGSLMLAAPARTLSTSGSRLRELRRSRRSFVLVTDGASVRLVAGLLTTELVEALRAAAPRLSVRREVTAALMGPGTAAPPDRPAAPGRELPAPSFLVREDDDESHRTRTGSPVGSPAEEEDGPPALPVRRPPDRSERGTPVGVRRWAVGPRYTRSGMVGGVFTAAVGTAVVGLFAWGGSAPSVVFAVFWVVALAWGGVTWLRTATSVELHPDGALALAGPASSLHTRVERVTALDGIGTGQRSAVVLRSVDGDMRLARALVTADLVDTLRAANRYIPLPEVW